MASRESNLEYWARVLKNPTLAALPADFVRPTPARSVESQFAFALPAATVAAAATLAAGAADGLYTVALAALATVVFRLSGDEDLVVGADDAAGAPFVVRSAVTGQLAFGELLAATAKLAATGSERSVPLAELVAHIQATTQAAETPVLFRTALLHASRATAHGLAVGGLTADLVIYVDEAAGALQLHYNSLLFKRERVTVIAEQLAQVIARAAADPAVAVGTIPLVTDRQLAVLPDPTKDLHWGTFRGAIHDIFAANAARHPDRLCVLETKNPFDAGTIDRPFTYRQIDEASNVLAHHLLASGVTLGDVVTVYAFRGVDLVVSVMGVLKAGATFSVIDPAYPPARQNIYLSVAQPKALVVLKKAGVLSPTVRKYIDAELQLATDVPALELQDDGTLLGGAVGGADVFAAAQAQKGVPTGVVVGPDSTPTLSFTSGSEGIPKGVRGRHFSLTYYFPWMVETFGLSEKDKFTMLSGIAHDPIQRDIFTPLFLGAHLLVPTADDIGTPGRLAEWMAENGASVTHLTPAMGQLLSAQATAPIPSLHHAFFVGDILTKRDCIRLQALARNVFIVNMYGTTETQRAVSYFEVQSIAKDPTFMQSQKDVIVAGKGMLDVQILVVNRHDRAQTCAVGEVGEIYVRAGGLAEEYLRLPDMTAQKFVKSWFVDDSHWRALEAAATAGATEPWRQYYKGARDRLYRTGDLGRYMPDGNVECSGRADDQVKIRGFRIELGEIDTHLSQHPLVRENVTLVKRDKDEEPTLISYVVPHGADALSGFLSGHESLDEEPDVIVRGLVKYRRLIKDIREYLKTKLPSYAVPTVIVPLSKMPLNPNGKVDKPALPFPDTAQLTAVAQRSPPDAVAKFTPTEDAIKDIWLAVLPNRPPSIAPADSFFDIGGHSILATRMIFEVRKKFIVDLPLGFIFKNPTLAALAAEIDSLKANDDEYHNVQAATSAAEKKKAERAEPAVAYADDAQALTSTLAPAYAPVAAPFAPAAPLTAFVTGATGFLGSYIVNDLLTKRGSAPITVVAHVRAPSKAAGFDRIKKTLRAYGVWQDSFADRIQIVTGDLDQPRLGVPEAEWAQLAADVDVIIHNGAQVHWVYPYSILRGPNVVGTVNVMALAAAGKPKSFVFVSSTSAVDTDYFVRLSDTIVQQGGAGVPESDDLQGSAAGLGTGYGQSKWAAEYLVRAAGKRGLTGMIVRPGYVTGESSTGTTNTDDFIVRMIKGCIQLGFTPDIYNTVNMVPVDHVARVVVAASLHAPNNAELLVGHVTGHPRSRFNEFLDTLATYGYNTKKVDYVPWRIALERYVVEEANDSALYPLLHFVLDNLPNNTKAPELDDTNTRAALLTDRAWTGEDVSAGKGVGEEVMGIYLAYLVGVGFIEPPPSKGALPLPAIEIPAGVKEALANVGGRGGKN
ncbi:uncharacterized protein V1510DRAFT_422821 [Dipodascopsis tothii]|uniref:uncharacterized protein n=1 Tax=Dipodascopsis tothii TaxID=44089 RepID=UPI0034CD6112